MIPIPIEVEEAVQAAEKIRIVTRKITPEPLVMVESLTVQTVIDNFINSVSRTQPSLFYEAPKKNKMASLLDRTLKRLKSLPKDIGGVLFKKITNPKTRNGFVAEIKPDGVFEPVRSLDGLKKLFAAIEDDMVSEENYTGADKDFVVLMSARLPAGYVAGCAAIKLGDLMRLKGEHFRHNRVVISLKDSPFKPTPTMEITCASEAPILSNTPGMERYHRISIKVEKKNKTISAWYPGAYHRNGGTLTDQTCFLGM
jgi:hypothetical protein